MLHDRLQALSSESSTIAFPAQVGAPSPCRGELGRSEYRLASSCLLLALMLTGGCDRTLFTRFLAEREAAAEKVSPAAEVRPSLPLGTAEPMDAVDHTNPTEVAHAFLTAVRDGRAERARQLMTDQAQGALQQSAVRLVAPGSPDATFHVGGPQFVSSDPLAAHLVCRWSDASTANPHGATEFILAMRRSNAAASNWRIVGLVQPTLGAPRIFNFETSVEISELARR